MGIRFGPAHLGGVKEAIGNLEKFSKAGMTACEIPFTYSVYIKKKEDAEKIGKKAEELGISLSIHGQYWINLNSEDPEKIKKSKERLLSCLEVGTWLGAKTVVFHAGFYGKGSREDAFTNIKNNLKEVMAESKRLKYTPKLAPEVMGKINVFGSIEEISKLVKETCCDCCIDFAHILARYKEHMFDETFDAFKNFKDFDKVHVHFSGIVYGEKGEKHHIETPKEEWEKLLERLKNLAKKKEIIIVNESPKPLDDAIKGLKIWNKINGK